MENNKLYFIKDEYFEKYTSDETAKNKGIDHDRPCYYAFNDGDIYWMVPISSRVEKYTELYNKAIDKYGTCDTLSFVYVKGNKNVALIQNMIPVTSQYVKNIYLDANTKNPIEINDKKRKEINAKVRKILRLSENGKKLTFTPILEFKERLLQELENISINNILDDTNIDNKETQ